MTQYAGADTFPTDFPLLDDTVPNQAAQYNVIAEALADRTMWLKNRVGNWRLIALRYVQGNSLHVASQNGGTNDIVTDVLANSDGFAITAANFVQPAVNANVSVIVSDTSWMTPGDLIMVRTGGQYLVASITDGAHCAITNTGLPGNAAPGVTITSPKEVYPALFATEVGDVVETELSGQIELTTGGATHTASLAGEFVLQDSQDEAALVTIGGGADVRLQLPFAAGVVYQAPACIKGYRAIASAGKYRLACKVSAGNDTNYTAQFVKYSGTLKIWRVFA